MTAHSQPPQLIMLPEDKFLQLMRDVSEIKLTLARATIAPAPDWVNIPEAARILGVTLGTVCRKIDKGEFEACGKGKARQIKLPRSSSVFASDSLLSLKYVSNISRSRCPTIRAHTSPPTSPARMAVSQEKRNAWNVRAVALVRSSPANMDSRSNSSAVTSRSRSGGALGLLTSCMELAEIKPQSRPALVSTESMRFILRLTLAGNTSRKRASRQSKKSGAARSPTRLAAI